MEMPAFCPSCGAVCGSGIELGGDVRNLSMSGNKTRCPVCGSWAEIPDGVYNFSDGVLEVLAAPAITVERLRRLQSILENARRGETEPEEAVEALRAEAPELASYLQRIKDDPAALAGWLVLLLMIIQLLVSGGDQARQDIKQTTNVVIRQCVQNPQPLRQPAQK